MRLCPAEVKAPPRSELEELDVFPAMMLLATVAVPAPAARTMPPPGKISASMWFAATVQCVSVTGPLPAW